MAELDSSVPSAPEGRASGQVSLHVLTAALTLCPWGDVTAPAAFKLLH